MKRKSTNPAKYERCVKAVAKRGGANPYAVCAPLRNRPRNPKRKKKNPLMLLEQAAGPVLSEAGKELHISPQQYGIPKGILNRGKGQKNARKSALSKDKRGRFIGQKRKNSGRRNPLDQAQAVYEGFHGRPSEQTVTITTPIHEHEVLSGIGDLEKLVIRSRSGRAKVTLTDFGECLLCQNEKRNQLFIEGGDQSVDLDLFGLGDPVHELEDLGELLQIWYYTIKDHLGDEGGEAVYHHALRKVKLRGRPTVIYDTVNKLLFIAGGAYSIPDEGIEN